MDSKEKCDLYPELPVKKADDNQGSPPPPYESPESESSSDVVLPIPVEGMALVIKAADFAARRHRFQKRKDHKGTPYINHPLGKFWQNKILQVIFKVLHIF